MRKNRCVRDAGADLLSAFHVCLDFLSRVFLDPPEEAFITQIVRENLFSEYPVPKNAAIREGLRILRPFCKSWSSGQLAALKSDHTRLFIGLERVLAPPYASVHLSAEHILFERQTLEAREFYRKQNLRVPLKDKVPDDFIGYELYFLSFLCRKAAGALQARDVSELDSTLDGISVFLSNHLLLWLDSFLADVKEKAATPYFRGLGFLVQGTVERLADFVQKSSGK